MQSQNTTKSEMRQFVNQQDNNKWVLFDWLLFDYNSKWPVFQEHMNGGNVHR